MEDVEEAVEELSESRALLHSRLSAPDNLFDPQVKRLVTEWLQGDESSNKRQRNVDYVIDMLSDGHLGYPSYVKLLMKWIDILENSNKKPKLEISPGESMVRNHLAGQALESFSTDKMDAVLEETNPPEWLLAMLENQYWRKFLGDIAGKKEASGPLIDFAVKAICKSGFYKELAPSEKTWEYFSVFKYMVVDAIKAVINYDKENPAELEKLREKFQSICSHSQYAHFFAMECMGILENCETLSDMNRAKIRRLRQGLETVPRDKQPLVMDLINPINRRSVGGLSASFSSGGLPDLAALLRTALAEKQFSPSILQQLYTLYSDVSRVVPPWPIRNSAIIVKLQHQLYNPFKPLGNDCIKHGAYLLAVATFRKEGVLPAEAELAERIEESIRICRDPNLITAQGFHSSSKPVMRLTDLATQFPPIAAGVVRMARFCLKEPQFQKSECYTIGSKTLMSILHEVMKVHPLQQIIVFYAIVDCLSTRPNHIGREKNVELKRLMIDQLIGLMECGFVFRVLEHIGATPFDPVDGTTDKGLLRYFIQGVSKTVGEPLSSEFAAALLKFLSSSRVTVLSEHTVIVSISELKAKCTNALNSNPLTTTTTSSPVHQYAPVAPPPREIIRLVPFRPGPQKTNLHK